MFETPCMAQGVSESDTAQASDPAKKPHQDLLLIDLNWDRLVGLQPPMKEKWYGRGINVSLMYDYPFNKNGNVSGAIGAGFSSHNYYYNGTVQRFDVDGKSYSGFTPVPDTLRDRGKISVNYVDVPIEIRFRSNKNSKGYRWKGAVGGRVGYLIQAHEKTIDPDGIKLKTYDYPHISKIRYGVTARVGYGSIMLYGFYSLSTFFEQSNSFQRQNALSIGVSIVPF